jgi:hypothetical protein
MTPRERITRALTPAGWTEETPRNRAETAFVRRGGAARELVLELHGDTLWLWIEADGDRRVLQMTFGDALDRVLAALVERQARLSVESYLQDYMALSAICPTSIVAWEQFEPGR